MAHGGIEISSFTQRIEIFFFQAGRFCLAVGAKAKVFGENSGREFLCKVDLF